MKQIMIMVSIVMICALWAWQSTGKCGEKNASAGKAYSLIDVPESGRIIGLAPDADSIIIGYESTRKIESVRLENGKPASTMWSIDCDKAGKYPYDKRAVWSKDQKFLTFRSNRMYPLELSRFRNFCIYAVEAASGKIREAGDCNCGQKPKLPDVKMTYDAAFIPGTESLLYHRYAVEGVELYTVAPGGGKSVPFRKAGGDGAFVYAVPLSEHAALVYVEPMMNRDPIRLTILSDSNVDHDVMKNDRNGEKIVWQMKAGSADARTFLIQEFIYKPQPGNMVISALKILRLNSDCTEWKTESIVGKKGMTIMDSSLSPDGKRVLYLQRADDSNGDITAISCYVREDSSERMVFEEKPDSVDDWALRWNGEGIIYMSDRAFVMHVGDRYRFYRFD